MTVRWRPTARVLSSRSSRSTARSATSVTAGSGASARDFTVTALCRAARERIDLHYEYPAFTGLAPRDEQDGGDIYAPAGTKVRVRVHDRQADRVRADGVAQAARRQGSHCAPAAQRRPVLEGELVLARDDSYRVRPDRSRRAPLVRRHRVLHLRVMDDRPPDVRILRPAGDQQITPLEEVAIEARADDDYGIALRAGLCSGRAAQPKVVPFTRGQRHRRGPKSGRTLLAAEDLRVKPGDVITYYARARDVGRGKRSTETRSDIFFLEVRPFNEEFVAAQSQAHGGHGERAARDADRRAERDHQRHLEHRAALRAPARSVGATSRRSRRRRRS